MLIATPLRRSHYRSMPGTVLSVPRDKKHHPDLDALRIQREKAGYSQLEVQKHLPDRNQGSLHGRLHYGQREETAPTETGKKARKTVVDPLAVISTNAKRRLAAKSKPTVYQRSRTFQGGLMNPE